MRARIKSELRGNSRVRMMVGAWIWKQDCGMVKQVGNENNC